MSVRWRKKGNTTDKARIYARKSPFAGTASARDLDILNVLRNAAAVNDYTLTGLWRDSKQDVSEHDMVLRASEPGEIPAFKFTFDGKLGWVKVSGKLRYNQVEHKFSTSAPLDIQPIVNEDVGTFHGWWVYARFFQNNQVLDVRWMCLLTDPENQAPASTKGISLGASYLEW